MSQVIPELQDINLPLSGKLSYYTPDDGGPPGYLRYGCPESYWEYGGPVTRSQCARGGAGATQPSPGSVLRHTT